MISPLQPRLPNSHKGDFGHVLVIGGDSGMGGAACLAAEAALRVGAGLVTVVTRAEHLSALLARCPEVMCYGVSDTQESIDAISRLIEKATVCVVGPGFGAGAWSQKVFEHVFHGFFSDVAHESKNGSNEKSIPYIIDGGALRLLSMNSWSHHNWVLTPHPGEAAALLNLSIPQVQKNRQKSVLAIQQQRGGVVVLKGAGTLVSDGSAESIYRNDSANPAMATAGMGDVLSGIVGGLIAQGCSLMEAASYGVWLHSHAGELVLKETSVLGNRRSILAHELFPYLSFS